MSGQGVRASLTNNNLTIHTAQLVYVKVGNVEVVRKIGIDGLDVGTIELGHIAIDNQLWMTEFPALLRFREGKGKSKVSADLEELPYLTETS